MGNSYGSLSLYTYAQDVQFLICVTALYIPHSPGEILVQLPLRKSDRMISS